MNKCISNLLIYTLFNIIQLWVARDVVEGIIVGQYFMMRFSWRLNYQPVTFAGAERVRSICRLAARSLAGETLILSMQLMYTPLSLIHTISYSAD